MNPHPHWQSLLTWLASHGADVSLEAMLVQARERPDAGYGLFALQTATALTRLFSVPNSALLNTLTLSPLYPEARLRLTATQLISLHLFLNRPVDSEGSADPVFGPYISTLPREFEAHPLTWLVKQNEHHLGAVLLSRLPPSVMHSLRKLGDRFSEDWRTVQRYLRITNTTESKATPLQSDPEDRKHRYLWAWLNVNTRCLYYRVEPSPSDKNNITLCPILDFANHTVASNHMSPHLPGATGASAPSRVAGCDFTILSPSSTTKFGDELYLMYGAHSNRTLFVEYGFINEITKDLLFAGSFQGDIDVQTAVESLFEARGKLGVWMTDVLKNQGYWGDWTLHSTPLPAHPSFRLIAALRLYYIFPVSVKEVPLNAEVVLLPWRATLLGTAEKITQENEDAWRDALSHLCNRLSCNATSAIESLDRKLESEWTTWSSWMIKNIRMLWEEELYVADAVADSIRAGEEF